MKCVQEIIDGAVKVASGEGYPPELTHKGHLFDAGVIGGMDDAETVARYLVGRYQTKAGMIAVFTAALQILYEEGAEGEKFKADDMNMVLDAASEEVASVRRSSRDVGGRKRQLYELDTKDIESAVARIKEWMVGLWWDR